MDLGSAGFGNNVGEAGSSVAYFGRHHSGTGADFLDRIHVKIGKGRSTQLRVGGVDAIHGEDGRGASLAVDGKLLSEIGSAIGIRHGPGRQQKELTEVTLVERQLGNLLARGSFASGGRDDGLGGPAMEDELLVTDGELDPGL